MRSCLIESQSLPLNKLYIAPHTILWWDLQVCLYAAILGLSRSYSTSLRSVWMSIGFTTVKNTDCPVPSVAFSTWDQSTLNDGVHLVSVPDAVDVLGEVKREQDIVLQQRINENFSWMSLNCSEVQDFIGWIRIQAILKTFSSFLLLLLPSNFPNRQLSIAKCQRTFPWTSQSGRQILLLHQFLEELTLHVAVFWSWILTLHNNCDWMVLD